MSHTKPPQKRPFSGSKTEKWQKTRQQPETAKKLPQKPLSPEKPTTRDSVLLWGTHAVHAAWLNESRKCYRLWMTETTKEEFQATLDEAKAQGLARPTPKIATRQEMDALVPRDTVHQGLILEAAPLPTPILENVIDADVQPDIIVVLDQVTDPHNVGAILRSAAAFGAGGVVVTERNAPQTTGVMAKTACGAADMIPLIPVVNLARAIQSLKKAGYWCIGLAEEGKENIQDTSLKGRIAVIMGAEGEGLRRLTRENCDALVRLPTQPPLGSLNVSNAAAITLYEIKRQQMK